MFRYKMLFTAIAVALAATARADDSVAVQPTVQVTASRVAETIAQTLADVSVITREDIDASGAADLLDLLRLQAGIEVARTGGAGAQTSVFMRGTAPNQMLVLLNGVRIASVNTGALAWEQLPLNAVQRIEIVRGPRASYWGSDAIGGVIQIFTRKLQGPLAAVQYGTHADASGSAGYGQWGDNGGFSVIAGLRHVTGYPTATPDNAYAYDGLDDGYRSRNLAAQGAYAMGAQTLSGNLLVSDANVEFPNGSTVQGRSHVIEQVMGMNLSGQLTAWWSERISVGQERESTTTPVYAASLTSHRNSIGWQNDFLIAPQQHLIAGIDYYQEHGLSTDTELTNTIYDEHRHNTGVYGGWQGRLDALDWELSGRRDDNSRFGSANTGALGAGYRVSAGARITGSFGQGFRSPTFNEQFSPGFGGYFAGNPDLRPERSHSSQLGLELTPIDGLNINASRYRTDVEDLINFVGPLNRAQNIGRARIDGTELTADWKSGPWSIAANATWQNPRNLDDDSELLRRARKKANVLVMREITPRISAGLELTASGPTRDISATNAGYALINARMSIALSPAWQLRLRAENLTGRDDTLVQGYRTPGRSGFVEILWQP
ncbi:MAG: TonB-dependent receptor [Rhodanobacter sp.]|jgi:vitamin B12 transporter|nr:TonB-dependent receptor [Rhodanobacter sp.]